MNLTNYTITAAITIKDFQLMKGMFTEFSLPDISLPTLKSIMILVKQEQLKELYLLSNINEQFREPIAIPFYLCILSTRLFKAIVFIITS